MFGASTPPPKPPARAASRYAPQGYQPPLAPGMQAPTPESNTMLFVGLGLGAVVLLGGAYFILKG